jgi:hypothetical protein
MKLYFNCSDKLSSKLMDIADKENCNISDLIEEAILKLYDISLCDIQNLGLDASKITKLENIASSNIKKSLYASKEFLNNYVYVYLDPRYPGKYDVADYHFKCKPFYVGKGYNDRKDSHLNKSHNDRVNDAIKKIKDNNLTPIVETLHDNLSSLEAHRLENNLIFLINQKYELCNISGGKNYDECECYIGFMGFNKNDYIIEMLNTFKTNKEVANKLGISERTLYRKIKSLKIIKKNGEYMTG